MHKSIALGFFGILLLGIVAAQQGSNRNSPAASIRYLALGDSYTIGESVAESERWPMQLRDSLMAHGHEVEWYKVIAHTGWKTRDLREAIAQIQPDTDYNLVSLLIGVNDYFQGRSVEEYKTRFQQLLEVAVAHAGGRKDRVFVVSIPDYSYTPHFISQKGTVSKDIDKFNALNRKITLAAGIRYFDITPLSRKGIEKPEWVCGDGLHPSGMQYAAWVQLMLPGLLEMLSK